MADALVGRRYRGTCLTPSGFAGHLARAKAHGKPPRLPSRSPQGSAYRRPGQDALSAPTRRQAPGSGRKATYQVAASLPSPARTSRAISGCISRDRAGGQRHSPPPAPLDAVMGPTFPGPILLALPAADPAFVDLCRTVCPALAAPAGPQMARRSTSMVPPTGLGHRRRTTP